MTTKQAVEANVRGIELDFFEVQTDYSRFQIQQRIWCHFRYHNRAGAEIEYGGIGIAVHKWTGQEWTFHYYRHSYAGELRSEGGPAPGGRAWRDSWKGDDVATFALTPFLTFDNSAKKREKRQNPTSIGDGHFMGKPVYVEVGGSTEPGGVIDNPPAPLFPEVDPKEEPEPFKFEVWPTVAKRITQKFGARPDYYKQFGFPGHEGIDLASPFDTPYMAVAAGKVIKVSDKRSDGRPSAYGWHIVVEHREGYSTLYAHAKPEIPVSEGQEVTAGQILGYSGSTGNSSGPHLHLTLKKKGYQLAGWRPGYMDPYDLLSPLLRKVEAPTGDLVEGYLWSPSLDMREGKLAVAKFNLNMRERPDKASRLIGVVKAGTTARILSEEKKGGGYLYCEASI
jgi:murein DD-endopeptidase MepM/ murein hydrolase activator NlpD